MRQSIASTFSGLVFLVGLTAVGCTKNADDCNYIGTCGGPSGGGSADDGGSSGGNSAGGNATGGVTSACNPACSGQSQFATMLARLVSSVPPTAIVQAPSLLAIRRRILASSARKTPIALEQRQLLIQLRIPASSAPRTGTVRGIRLFATPLRTPAFNAELRADCTSASASACVAGTCTGCSADADCSHITGNTVCKLPPASIDAGTDTGSCVQCTGAKYSACGQSATSTPLVCDSLSNTCSTQAQASAGLCQTCVSDAQCQAGEMCVNEVFNGSSVGYFCFYKQGATGAPAVCGNPSRPYSGLLKNASSIDGQVADICSLVVSTCPALSQFRSKDCTSAGAASDQLCGFAPGVDSKCVAFTSPAFVCTDTCLSDWIAEPEYRVTPASTHPSAIFNEAGQRHTLCKRSQCDKRLSVVNLR